MPDQPPFDKPSVPSRMSHTVLEPSSSCRRPMAVCSTNKKCTHRTPEQSTQDNPYHLCTFLCVGLTNTLLPPPSQLVPTNTHVFPIHHPSTSNEYRTYFGLGSGSKGTPPHLLGVDCTHFCGCWRLLLRQNNQLGQKTRILPPTK